MVPQALLRAEPGVTLEHYQCAPPIKKKKNPSLKLRLPEWEQREVVVGMFVNG